MQLELTDEERQILIQLVDREIGDLGPEIHHTQTGTVRSELKLERRMLKRLLDYLRSPTPVQVAS